MLRGIETVVVNEVISGRYPGGIKPRDWSQRVSGIDVVMDENGRVFKLFSEGDQSVPRKGSILVLEPITTHSVENLYRWTLYGFKPETDVSLDEF
jgi:hypothetical protein